MTADRVNKKSIVISIGLAVLVFLVSVRTPLGVASGVPYIAAVLVGLGASNSRYVIGLASVCTLLTIAGAFLSPGMGGTELWKVIANRVLAIFAIWVTTILGLLRKHSERERLEAEQLARERLTGLAHIERLKTAGQFAAGLAHELNQPLTAISLQSEIATHLARVHRHDEEQRLLDALREITEQSQRAAEIIRMLRNFVHKSPPQRSAIPINGLVRDIVRLLESQFERSGIELQLQLEQSLPCVWGDPIQIGQVILNLLQNALESLETHHVPGRLSVRTAVAEGGFVQVTVSDNGPGIAADQVERIFEHFHTTKPSGLGMGLAISRSIVEDHSGRIWIETGSASGATFAFTVPVATAPTPEMTSVRSGDHS